MSRRNKPPKRTPLPDPVFNSIDVAKFVNRLMRRGKKSIAERIFYDSMEIIKEKTLESREEMLKHLEKPKPTRSPLEEYPLGGGGNVSTPSLRATPQEGNLELPTMLTQKLLSSIQIPTVKTEHTIENLTKTAIPQKQNVPPTSGPKVDPYREIPE